VRSLPNSNGAVLVVGVSLAQRNHALTVLDHTRAPGRTRGVR